MCFAAIIRKRNVSCDGPSLASPSFSAALPLCRFVVLPPCRICCSAALKRWSLCCSCRVDSHRAQGELFPSTRRGKRSLGPICLPRRHGIGLRYSLCVNVVMGTKRGRPKRFFTSFSMTVLRHSEAGSPAEESHQTKTEKSHDRASPFSVSEVSFTGCA